VETFEDENVSFVAFRTSSPNPKENSETLLGTHQRGVFVNSEDTGNWEPRNQGLIYRDIHTLFVSGNALYAGTPKDLFKWEDASKRWMPASEGIQNKSIYSIAGDPDGKILFAGSGPYSEEKGFFDKIPCLYKSTDQGLNWTPSDKGVPDGALVYTIAVNPNQTERVYLGTSDGVYRSTNAGRDWAKMDQGLPKDLKVFDIRIARMADGKDAVYMATSAGVFMTIDDDETRWVNKSYGLEPSIITSTIIAEE
jgi:hypothetical protein